MEFKKIPTLHWSEDLLGYVCFRFIASSTALITFLLVIPYFSSSSAGSPDSPKQFGIPTGSIGVGR